MSANEFAPGQRWISNAETELGLGIVAAVTDRRVEITFPAAAQQRVYAADNAPLGRVIYPVGDRIRNAEGETLRVTRVKNHDGCAIYLGLDEQGNEAVLHEIDLDSFVHFSQPKDRLFAGQVDKPARYQLRCATLRHRHRIRRSPVHGLLGARVQLLPHQLYIASEVARRFEPRVLLADEVGLGKTIEAGLILHQQLISGRASRALVVVPDSLVHQWLVEMLRRFNLRFTILDEARCQAIEAGGDDAAEAGSSQGFSDEEDRQPDASLDAELPEAAASASNPFESAQLVLCALSFLVDNPDRAAQAMAAGWDLLVVDEAHHLYWNEREVSPAYTCIEGLARQVGGVLLLTATPEQLGIEGHFARLRLLDSDRYYDLNKFREEERGYQAVSALVAALLAVGQENNPVAWDKLLAELSHYLGEDAGQALSEVLEASGNNTETGKTALEGLVAVLIQRLLDRHGTGRVLFRNTRDGVTGFPRRVLNIHLLEALPDGWLRRPEDEDVDADLNRLLRPEQSLGETWLSEDARVVWLVAWLAEHRREKTLLICASARTARQLEEYLRLRQGVRSAVFHEQMSLLERDRAAAYFADEDEPAQVLVCSEIGSEGRNFQFCRHLILFDLPLNPDLLEQRIGRLDRIGQIRDVQIHTPCHRDGAPAALVRWYHEGLNAFERVCPVGPAIYSRVQTQLHDCLRVARDEAALAGLIKRTRELAEAALNELQQGRDRLLEMNSCNRDRAEAVIAELSALSQGTELAAYLDAAFDEFGVDQHYHSPEAVVVEPGDHMLTHALHGLPEDGLTATFSRTRALSREDMHYFTWEHPLVAGLMDSIADGDFGSTTISTIKLPALKPGTLLLEAVFTLHCLAPRALQPQRYMSDSLVRVLVDEKGRDLSAAVNEERLAGLCKPVKKNVASELSRHIRSQVEILVGHAEALVRPLQQQMITGAQQQARQTLGEEIQRMQALAAINPNIRGEEIDYLHDTLAALEAHLGAAQLKMDALRVVVNVP